MRKIILMFLFPFVILFAQDDGTKNPNVELPDFIITGKDVISIKRAKKIEPDLVPVVTESFLKPKYKPEELGLRQLSNPIKEELNLLDSVDYFNGSLNVDAGIYTLPGAEFGYTYPFSNGIVQAKVGGNNQLAYIDNSGRYSVYGGASFDYTIGFKDASASGTKFYLGGDYTSLNYKLFASTNPGTERVKNFGNFFLGVKNVSGDVFVYDLEFDDYLTSLTNETFTENLLDTKGFLLFRFADVSIGFKGNYQKQFYTNNMLDNAEYDYVFMRPYVAFEILSTLKAKVGYTFTHSGSQKFNNIYASFGLKFSKNLVLLGEFSPEGEFITSGKYLRENDYFNVQLFNNIFFRKSNYYDVSLKYEYGTFYQIDGGLRHYKSGNLPYYSDSNQSGKFDIATADAEEYNAYLNLLYNTGPYGFLYSTIDLYKVTNKDGKRIPYYPKYKLSLTYGYRWDKLLIEVPVDYYSNRYTDIANTNKLNSFFNLGLGFTYTLDKSLIIKLNFNNLLNRNIYYWNGYKEKPFEVTAGFNYLFD